MMNDVPSKRSLYDISERTKKRNAAEGRFRLYGIIAIAIGLLMLLVLVTPSFTVEQARFNRRLSRWKSSWRRSLIKKAIETSTILKRFRHLDIRPCWQPRCRTP